MHSTSQHPVMGGWAPFCAESPDETITDANRHVELVLRWRQRVVDVRRVRDVDEVRVGRNDDVCVPISSFAALTRVNRQWFVQVPAGVTAVAQQEGRGATALPGAGRVALLDGTTLTLDLGAHTLQVRTVARSRSLFVPAAFDALWANIGVVVLAGVVTLLAALWWHPANVDDLGLEALQANASTYRPVLLAPTPNDNAILQRLQVPPANASNAVLDRSTLDRSTTARAGKQGADVQQRQRSDHDVVADQLQALFGGSDGVGEVFAGALNVALRGVTSTKVASLTPQLRGAGGLGDGDGTTTGTISVGTIHTRGGKGKDAGYGTQTGGIGDKVDHDVVSPQTVSLCDGREGRAPLWGRPGGRGSRILAQRGPLTPLRTSFVRWLLRFGIWVLH